MKRNRTKKATIGCTPGDVCNTNDVVRADMWSDIGGPMLISPVHKAMFATQTILNTPKLDREAAKIGQTCEATSEAQC